MAVISFTFSAVGGLFATTLRHSYTKVEGGAIKNFPSIADGAFVVLPVSSIHSLPIGQATPYDCVCIYVLHLPALPIPVSNTAGDTVETIALSWE
jgi:hypothetical protein